MRTSLILLAALGNAVWADELILKDGKRVEWKTLSDEGDTYEITTPQGTKITIKKDDVESLAKKKAPEILTGASFTFDKKRKLETVDLLPKIDTKKDAIGSWRFNGAALVGNAPDTNFAKMKATYTPPEEYDLTIVAEPKAGNELFIGLVAGGKQFTVHFDAAKGSVSGIWQVDGKGGNENGTGIPGKFFFGKPRTITFMVRKEGMVVQADGKDFMTYKGDWSRVSLHPALAVQDASSIFVGLRESSFQITKMVLTSPK